MIGTRHPGGNNLQKEVEENVIFFTLSVNIFDQSVD